MTFDQLKAQGNWRAIPDCPGRFVLSVGPSPVPPEKLIGPDVEVTEHQVAAAKDPVLVARLDDGGLISYRKSNGTFVHTLNTSEGFERKLRQLRIDT
jgi:hypothetical protein